MMDVNEDVCDSVPQAFLNANGLQDVILSWNDPLLAPATYSTGSVPIDGIFVTGTLALHQAGYDEFVSWTNHQCIWINLTYEVAFGHNMPPIVHARARRLKLNDPRVVKAYLDKWQEYITTHRLDEKAYALQAICMHTDATNWGF